MRERIVSIQGVVDVEVLRGAAAPDGAEANFLVEVPHGADQRSHYEAVKKELRGELPPELEIFFHFNTDVGAWAYGRATAEAALAARPSWTALLVRSLIPRTFIDCNRPSDFGGDDEAKLTPGLPSYIRDPDDQRLLKQMHSDYVSTAGLAFDAVCARGGLVLVPHTYGRLTLDIAHIGDDIAERLREALAPDHIERWPLRSEIDLLTRDPEGTLLAPRGAEEMLLARFREAGFEPAANDTYCLQPPTLAHGLSARYPGRVLCLEVRRDLLVKEWKPFEEMLVDEQTVARIGSVLAGVLTRIGEGSGSSRT